MNQLAIAGCGWLGLKLAVVLASKGWSVSGCSRNPATLAQLTQANIDNCAVDIDTEFRCDQPQTLFQGDTLLINLPPGRHQQDNRYCDRIRLLVRAAKQHGISKALFVSSTAVYADGLAHPEVDEDSPLANGARAEVMLDAEAVIKAEFEQWMILRPGGLVGGQRHPGRFLAGKQQLAGADAPVNMVHRDDVIAAIEFLLAKPQWQQHFNLAAPTALSRQEFYVKATAALGLEAPTFSDLPQSGKRVISRNLQQLGFQFTYPNPLIMPLATPSA